VSHWCPGTGTMLDKSQDTQNKPVWLEGWGAMVQIETEGQKTVPPGFSLNGMEPWGL
jgi:hypothetical protein